MVSERYGSYAYVYILTPTVNCAIEDLIIIYRDSGSAEITVNDSPINSAVPIESTKLFLDTWMPIAVDGPDTISVLEQLTCLHNSYQGNMFLGGITYPTSRQVYAIPLLNWVPTFSFLFLFGVSLNKFIYQV
jgi:hypothetical protein